MAAVRTGQHDRVWCNTSQCVQLVGNTTLNGSNFVARRHFYQPEAPRPTKGNTARIRGNTQLARSLPSYPLLLQTTVFASCEYVHHIGPRTTRGSSGFMDSADRRISQQSNPSFPHSLLCYPPVTTRAFLVTRRSSSGKNRSEEDGEVRLELEETMAQRLRGHRECQLSGEEI